MLNGLTCQLLQLKQRSVITSYLEQFERGNANGQISVAADKMVSAERPDLLTLAVEAAKRYNLLLEAI